jgi:diguanylate cyclase (GGDEF)-like protein
MASTGHRPAVGTRAPRWVRGCAVVLAALSLGYVGSLVLSSDPGYDVLFDGFIANLTYALPGVLVLARAWSSSRHRLAYALLGSAMLVQTLGNALYVFHVQYLSPVPYPSVADLAYLLVYPLLLGAVASLARIDLGRAQRALWLDGLIAVLGTASGGAVLGLRAILPRLEGDLPALLTNAAYPVLDLVLASMVVGVVTVRGRRPSWLWSWLGAGLLLYGVGDSFYLYRIAQGTFHSGTVLDASWAMALVMMAVAVWRPGPTSQLPEESAPQASGSIGIVIPVTFSLVSVGVLVAGTRAYLPAYVVGLSAAALVAGVARTALAFRSLRALAETFRQSRTDDLTGLPNRRRFTEHLQATLEDVDGGRKAAVALLDLDGFKEVNDSLGHQAGDELLRQIGPRLAGSLRPGDELARLGGDEFALVMPGADVAEAAVQARLMREALSAPFAVDGVTVKVGGSIGIALFPEHSREGLGLLQCADIAMYAAKSAGTGVAVYDPARDVHSRERLETMQQLRLALDRDEFEVHYQPQVAAESGRVPSVEALVRWLHPQRGLLYPGAFIQLAEQAGLMPQLTLAVLDKALRQCAEWRRDGHELAVAVNLSAGNLADVDLPFAVSAMLERHGLPSSALVLEITEDMLMTDPEQARQTLRALRNQGVALSVDDYGTGYGSLEYLRDLPVHELKLDRTFVRRLARGTADAAIVTSTVELAHALGLRMVAEGVEDTAALDLLRELGVDLVQGYHLCRPGPARDITAWLVHSTDGAVPSLTSVGRRS